MNKKLQVATIAILIAALGIPRVYADDKSVHFGGHNGIQRVLLISIDGMHALDYENCVAGGYCPQMASLGLHGVTYTRTSASKPSDSFPGLMALVTGATPKTHGAFYDVAYDRLLAPPTIDTGNGVFAGTCTANTPNGTTTEFEEGVDFDQSKVTGGGPYANPIDGGIKSINPLRLPRDPYKNCTPVYPWQFIRTNSIYGVIHAAGGYTAWSDKHPVYAAVSGRGDTAANVDDYYAPEVDSDVIALPGITAANGRSCAAPTGSGTWKDDFQDIQCYDTLKVNSILNEIAGKSHLGDTKTKVPNIFGMNFQAVSVGQKLIEKGVFGGYMDAAGTPTPKMKDEIMFVDASIDAMVDAMKGKNLMDSTLIIITAKHGQSPIDTNRFQKLGKGITTTPADVIASFLPPPPAPQNPNTPDAIGPTQDDVSVIWLKRGASVTGAVNLLEASGTAGIGLGEIFYGPSLETMFNAPGLPPNGDPRTPDIIVQPNVGVVYTGSSKKQAEHGGFAHDDTNVMLLVANSQLDKRTVTSFVETTQVAPTILKALGLDPNSLDGVKKEGTPVLPGLDLE